MPKKSKPIKGISLARQDKENIRLAKKMISKGLLSKQVKFHDDKYISKEVLRKVREYSKYTSKDFNLIKVSPQKAKQAKESGYVVVNNRIIAPKGKRAEKAIKEGLNAGIKPLKRGYLEEIALPITVTDMAEIERFVNDLYLGPDEQLAFSFYGNKSHFAFPSKLSMLQHLEHYKSVAGTYENEEGEDVAKLVIVRAHMNDINDWIPTPSERERANRARRKPRISNMSDETKARRRRMDSASKSKQRKYESPEKKAARQAKDRAAKAAKRQIETDAQREERRKRDRERKRKK